MIGFAVIVTSSPNGSLGWLGAVSAGVVGVAGAAGVAAWGQDGASPTSTSPPAASARVTVLRNENIGLSLSALRGPGVRGKASPETIPLACRAALALQEMWAPRMSAFRGSKSQRPGRLANRRSLAI